MLPSTPLAPPPEDSGFGRSVRVFGQGAISGAADIVELVSFYQLPANAFLREHGLTSEEFEPRTAGERILATAGEFVGAGGPIFGAQYAAARFAVSRGLTAGKSAAARILAETAANPAKVAATEAVIGATAGLGAGAAQELFPDNQGVAGLAGGLVGIFGGLGAIRALKMLKAGASPVLIAEEVPFQSKPSARFEEPPLTATTVTTRLGTTEERVGALEAGLRGEVTPAPPRGEPFIEGTNINRHRMAASKAESQSTMEELLEGIAKENIDLDEVTRGTQSLVQTEQAAMDLVRDTGLKFPGFKEGRAFNAEHITGFRILLQDNMEKVTTLSEKLAAGTASPAELLEHRALLEETVNGLKVVMGGKAELGRAMSAQRIIARGQKFREQALSEIVDETLNVDDQVRIAKAFLSLDSRAQQLQFAAKSIEPKFVDKLLEVYINSLLSGPQTQAVNITSNALFAALQIPERLLAKVISKVPGIGSGKISITEVPAEFTGFYEGLKDGLRIASKTFRTEQSAIGLTKLDIQATRQQAIKGPLGRFTRIPSRALLAMDDLFKSVGYRMELRALAARQARKEIPGKLTKGKLSPEGIDRFVKRYDELTRNPTAEMIAAATKNAEYVTFTNKLGPAGQKFLGVVRDVPALRLIIPFVRTPINIAKRGMERLPITAPFMKSFRQAIKNGGADRDLALARVTMGSIMAGGVMSYASDGLITGSGPSNPEARRVWLQDHQPNSIKVGDKWVSYGRLEPFAVVMGIAADAAQIMGSATKEEGEDIATGLTFSLAKNLVDKTFLRGLGNAIEALNDPDRFGQKFISELASTAITPTILAQSARVTDPIFRDTKPDETLVGLSNKSGIDSIELGIQRTINRITSRIPGLSDKLPPVRDLWGEPIAFEGGLGPDIISPLYTRRWKNDNISQEMLRLNLSPGFIKREAFGVKLSPEEYDKLSEISGQLARQQAESIVNSPAWVSMPDLLKKNILEGIFRSARSTGRAMLFAQSPDVQTRFTEAITSGD